MKQQILWFSYQLWRLLNSLSQSVLEDVSPHLCDMCILWSPLVDLSKVIAWRSQKKNTSFRDAPRHIMWQSPPLKQGVSFPSSALQMGEAPDIHALTGYVLLTYMLSQATCWPWHRCSTTTVSSASLFPSMILCSPPVNSLLLHWVTAREEWSLRMEISVASYWIGTIDWRSWGIKSCVTLEQEM